MALGSTPDWDAIVERHAARVFRVALRIVGSVQDAEDVSQEVFAEAYRLHSRVSVQSWTGLLVRLATLRAIDKLRRSNCLQEVRDGDRVARISPYDQAVANELAVQMRAALARLPARQSAVFTMCYFEQMARDDIAASLNLSPEAVSTALYKARRRLLAELEVFQRGPSQ